MISKKKKIIVLVGMIALLVVAGGLNIFLNLYNKGGDSPVSGNTYGNFFETYRVDRQTTRDQTILYLDAARKQLQMRKPASSNLRKIWKSNSFWKDLSNLSVSRTPS